MQVAPNSSETYHCFVLQYTCKMMLAMMTPSVCFAAHRFTSPKLLAMLR